MGQQISEYSFYGLSTKLRLVRWNEQEITESPLREAPRELRRFLGMREPRYSYDAIN